MTFTVSEAEKQELACVYAALALYDDKAPVTGDNINKLLKAANSMIVIILNIIFRSKIPTCKTQKTRGFFVEMRTIRSD